MSHYRMARDAEDRLKRHFGETYADPHQMALRVRDTVGASLAQREQHFDPREPIVEDDVLAALALMPDVRAEVEETERDLIGFARAMGAEWESIAARLDLATKQAAQQRFGRLRAKHPRWRPPHPDLAGWLAGHEQQLRAGVRALEPYAELLHSINDMATMGVKKVTALAALLEMGPDHPIEDVYWRAYHGFGNKTGLLHRQWDEEPAGAQEQAAREALASFADFVAAPAYGKNTSR